MGRVPWRGQTVWRPGCQTVGVTVTDDSQWESCPFEMTVNGKADAAPDDSQRGVVVVQLDCQRRRLMGLS